MSRGEQPVFDVDPILLDQYRRSIDFTNFPREFVQRFKLLDDDTQQLWYSERFKCLKYHLYLSGFALAKKAGDESLPNDYVPILGMDFQYNPHSRLFARFLQKRPGENKVLSELETITKKMMILWPRGLFKTSAVIVDIIQTILNYPNIRICFLTGGDNLAKRQLKRVKKFFEQPSKRFKWLFPEFCLKSVRNKKIEDELDPRAWTDVQPKMGTAHDFTVPCRNNDTFAEPTFAISTARAVKAGSHFDLIYIDDLVNDQNYKSATALEKCYQDYLDITPLLDPVGFIVMTGTRYSWGDTYERIQTLAKEEMQKKGRSIWSFSIRDCWSHGCIHCKHSSVFHDFDTNISQPSCVEAGCTCPGFTDDGRTEVLFPETRAIDGRFIGHTMEYLDNQRAEEGPEFFANQYENRPIAVGAQVFTEALIGSQTVHEWSDIPSYQQSTTFVVGDLAYVGEAGRDYSVLFVCRLFQGRIYIIDCLYGNWDSDKIAENTIAVILKHRPSAVYYEKFNGWEAYNNVIATYAMTSHLEKVPLMWLKGSQAANAKSARIGSVKGGLVSKRLWIWIGMPGYQILMKQLTKWPKLGRHDDFADTAGMVLAAPTGYELQTPPEAPNVTNWLRRYNSSGPEPEADSRIAGSYGSGSEDESWK